MISLKKVEVFCGTGGVGKTTIATARAMHLAQENKKVLLITIDPAKRLKQILHLDDLDNGEVTEVELSVQNNQTVKFDALLMSPGSTLKRMAQEKGLTQEFESTIIKTLSRPHGGMNEIMSIIEVQYQLKTQKYDTIILDTPPGQHFIDFLESSEKIKNFFDKSFLEIFSYLGKSVEGPKQSQGFFGKIISSGVNKLLSYLEAVTGAEFVREFIDAILALYKCRESFLTALDFQKELRQAHFSNWFLVTSVEQQKMDDAKKLKDLAAEFIHKDLYLIINKCHSAQLTEWSPKENTPLSKLKSNLLERENNLADFASKNFTNVLKFQEIYDSSPLEHVKSLSSQF